MDGPLDGTAFDAQPGCDSSLYNFSSIIWLPCPTLSAREAKAYLTQRTPQLLATGIFKSEVATKQRGRPLQPDVNIKQTENENLHHTLWPRMRFCAAPCAHSPEAETPSWPESSEKHSGINHEFLYWPKNLLVN